MTTIRKQTTKQRILKLERVIARRERLIRGIIDATYLVLTKFGEVCRHASSATHTAFQYYQDELCIYGYFGQSKTRRNGMEIKNHGVRVFDADWKDSFGVSDVIVNHFQSGEWQKKLSAVARKVEKKIRGSARKENQQTLDEKRLQALQLVAKRLGLK